MTIEDRLEKLKHAGIIKGYISYADGEERRYQVWGPDKRFIRAFYADNISLKGFNKDFDAHDIITILPVLEAFLHT